MSNRRNRNKNWNRSGQQNVQAKSGELRKITTKSGFQCSIPVTAMDNWDIVEAVMMIKDGNASKRLESLYLLANAILGDQGRKRLIEHVRRPDGRVPISQIDIELGEIMALFNAQSKNSQSSPS